MAYHKRIVCLANSYKPPNGRCLAGKEVLAAGYGEWIRPVSARPTAELSFAEYGYENKTAHKLLDIVDIQLSNADPRHHQVENHVIDAARWAKVGEVPWDAMDQLLDHPQSLW